MSKNDSNHSGDKPKLSPKQKEQLKKYAVFAAMGLICVGCFFIIFSPSKDEKAKREQSAGFNADIPMPKEDDMIGDKRLAYEQEQLRQRQSERMRSLQDFTALINDNAQNQTDDLSLGTDDETVTLTESIGRDNSLRSSQPSSIEQSAMAYRDMNRSITSFYERPREDPEKERLKQELEEMKTRMDEAESRRNSQEDPLDFMEKSFQLASKYMPGISGTTASPAENPFASAELTETGTGVQTTGSTVSNNSSIAPTLVAQVRDVTVSALLPDMSDTEFFEMYSQPRNVGFLTATTEGTATTKNTVSACIHNDQTIMDGQNVKLRLLDPIRAGNIVIPRNTLLTGTAKIQGERLGININSLEHSGTILTIDLRVYDLDGLNGIFIPNMQEINAAKEIVANLGTNAGTSISLTDDAEKQFIADMGRNVIQGVSQFTAKKLREVKVHLKAGYKVYLISEESLKAGKQQLANR